MTKSGRTTSPAGAPFSMVRRSWSAAPRVGTMTSRESPSAAASGGPSREDRHGAAEGVQIGDANESRPARCDHRSGGGRRSNCISLLARAASMRAPAAADDASQARGMLLASVASRLICTALSAICAALTSSACAARSSSGGSIADAPEDLRGGAVYGGQRAGGRPGQRLDVLERRLHAGEERADPPAR